MKLILLPGMDGTCMLFEPLLKEINDLDFEVVPLPNSGPQDYATLAETVAKAIGSRECVLLAESFSGGIAKALIEHHPLNIRHIIFVASFLSTPSTVLSKLATKLPIKALATIPVLAPLIVKGFFLGWAASPRTITLFQEALKAVDARVLNSRLRQIAEFRFGEITTNVGATYIRPKGDLLVSDRSQEFKAAFPNLKIIELAGPHFILQAEPEMCAEVIMDTAGHLISKRTEAP